MIRVMLVDDHTMVRQALRIVLEKSSAITVAAEAGDGESALRIAGECKVDVVVMDVALPGLSGIEATQRLVAEHPQIKVLALSTYLDRRIVEQILKAGATGYVLKSAAGEVLEDGILSVMQGKNYFSSEVSALLGEQLQQPLNLSGETGIVTLTQRERQVARLLAHGKSAPEIASTLFISPRTVEVHRRNIMSKLDLHKAVDLTTYAIHTGLIMD